MGITAARHYQIPDALPITENAGISLIDNLTIQLSKHLRNVRDDASRVTCFIETRWLPQRERSVKEISYLITTHSDKNITLKKIQISSKSISAAGKLAAILTLPFPPLAAFTLALSIGADAVSEGVSIAKAKNVNDTAKIAESTLLEDREITLQLHEILSGYTLLLMDIEDDIAKLHKATLDGSFDKVRTSPSVAKFLKKVRSTDKRNPNFSREILKAFSEMISDQETYNDAFAAMGDLLRMNPDIKNCMFEGVEIFTSSLCMTLLTNTVKNATGRIAFAGVFTFLLFLKDCNDIGNMMKQDDQTTYDLKNILRELKQEMLCLEGTVKDVRKRSGF